MCSCTWFESLFLYFSLEKRAVLGVVDLFVVPLLFYVPHSLHTLHTWTKANLPTLTNQPSLRNSDNLVSRTSAEPSLSQSRGRVGTRGPCERRPAWEGGERPSPSPGERGTLSSVCSLPSGTLSPPAPPDCHVTVM